MKGMSKFTVREQWPEASRTAQASRSGQEQFREQEAQSQMRSQLSNQAETVQLLINEVRKLAAAAAVQWSEDVWVMSDNGSAHKSLDLKGFATNSWEDLAGLVFTARISDA